MKAHFIIKFKEAAPTIAAPYWADIIEKKTTASDTVNKEIDSIIQRYGIKFWVTREFNPHMAAPGQVANLHWDSIEKDAGLNRIYRIIMQQDGTVPEALLNELRSLSYISKVFAGEIAVSDIPDQSIAVSMGILTSKASEQIYLEQAHMFSKGVPAIKIAVLDTGVDHTHPEIKHAMRDGMDMVDILDGADKFIGDYLEKDMEPLDEVGHGSHVTGIIAAKGIKMPVGVVPKCTILPVRVLGAMQSGGRLVGAGLIDNISAGIKWAVDNGAHVINMSLGVKHSGGGLPHKEVIEYAINKGVTVVAASGNDGTNDKYYPGALNRVIAVGAVDSTNKITDFSTYGSHISMVAPGFQIYSSGLDHGYAFASGTSQASPFVAGSIALLKSYAYSKGMQLPDTKLKMVLKITADRNFYGYKDMKYGYGKINLIDSLKYIDHHFKNL